MIKVIGSLAHCGFSIGLAYPFCVSTLRIEAVEGVAHDLLKIRDLVIGQTREFVLTAFS